MEQSLRPLDGKSAGLVYQPTTLVGAQNSCLVPGEGITVPDSISWRRMDPRSRRSRHLVQLLALAVCHYGVAGKNIRIKKFYPTTDLVTGPDIIFFWVARMIMAGFEYMGELPFRNVYFTGLIRDGKGRKLSKSLGNSPDPLDLISKYGADGLRFGLLRIAPQGADIRYDEKQMEEGRNFANKLWNACRFRQQQGPSDPQANPLNHPRTPFSDYLLSRLDRLERELDTLYQGYEFSQVAQALYAFVWDEFCARFIETAKADFMNAGSPTRPGTLATADFVLSRVLRLLHPFMPFITEELWLTLGLGDKTIQYSAWPKVGEVSFNVANAQAAESCYGTAEAGRRLRGEFGLSGSAKMKFSLNRQPHLGSAMKTYAPWQNFFKWGLWR